MAAILLMLETGLPVMLSCIVYTSLWAGTELINYPSLHLNTSYSKGREFLLLFNISVTVEFSIR